MWMIAIRIIQILWKLSITKSYDLVWALAHTFFLLFLYIIIFVDLQYYTSYNIVEER